MRNLTDGEQQPPQPPPHTSGISDPPSASSSRNESRNESRAAENPFSSDNSDGASLGSDQYLFSDFKAQSTTPQITYNDAGYSSSNPDLIYSPNMHPNQDTFLPRESPVSPDRITYPNSNYPQRSTSGARLAPGTAAGTAGTAGEASPFNASSRPSSTSLAALGSAEYDRYPTRISSSAAASIMSGNNLRVNSAQSRGLRNSAISGETASLSGESAQLKPFINSDFSPFGGYPASSFPLHIDEKEADDYLHNPDPILDAQYDRKCQKLDKRGWLSLSALICLILGGIALFIIYPVLTYTGLTQETTTVVQQVELLTNYQYNVLSAIRTSLIDPDTPAAARNFTGLDGSRWQLVFSDEFNKEGRTFYEGDDQFWTAPDIHYAATQDLEWYDPDAAMTESGALVLTLDAFKNHNLFYRSGMVQSWNKMCFTQGYLEVSAQLPGYGHVLGLWPGIWTLGNLGRPGYLGTTEGVWPYCYSECDAGITPNQSSTDGISYLKGQKLSACTCPGADHPNPGVGRGAPEIDALEGTVSADLKVGVVSQSVQLAPYDIWYTPDMNFIEIYNKTITVTNTWFGGPLQQAVSMATTLNTTWYEYSPDASYQTFGFEYLNDDSSGYIRWFIGKTATHTLFAPSLGPNGNIGQRQISKEPMSVILNLGISNAWVYIDWPSLIWPSHMRIDYVRIYQPPNAVSITCDPAGYPTYDYIEGHRDVYDNPNITSWEKTEYEWPKNKLTGC